MLHNVQITCPLITTYVVNTYNHKTRLSIPVRNGIISGKGTAQSDPAAMTIYALG